MFRGSKPYLGLPYKRFTTFHNCARGRIYDVKRDLYHSTGHRILIKRVCRELLGDITKEDAQAEGGYTVEEFKEVWRRINGSWDPDKEVVVYEFQVVDKHA